MHRADQRQAFGERLFVVRKAFETQSRRQNGEFSLGVVANGPRTAAGAFPNFLVKSAGQFFEQECLRRFAAQCMRTGAVHSRNTNPARLKRTPPRKPSDVMESIISTRIS